MHKGFDSCALKIAGGLVLVTGLAIGSYRLIGAQRASAQTQKKAASPPSGFDAVIRNMPSSGSIRHTRSTTPG
jgi:hypothetical protein